MLTFIINCYYTILLAIGLTALTVFIVGLFWIFKKKKDFPPTRPMEIQEITTSQPPSATTTLFDVTAFSGEDPVATQLDLAHAYLQTGKKQLAKELLHSVVARGSQAQQLEASTLLNTL